jgi:hypothetical protein
MRLSIHVNDGSVYVDGICHTNLDMSWVPTFGGIKVHALQWYDDHGEIELVTTDSNIEIKELGIFEQAVALWQEKHKEVQKNLEEEEKRKKLLEEEEERIRKSVEMGELQYSFVDDEQMYYDIEELLKEI